MENSAPSNVWTYCARWHRCFVSFIETNVLESHVFFILEISCLLCMSFCFVILYVTIWWKDNKLIIYLQSWDYVITLKLLTTPLLRFWLIRSLYWDFAAFNYMVSVYPVFYIMYISFSVWHHIWLTHYQKFW